MQPNSPSIHTQCHGRGVPPRQCLLVSFYPCSMGYLYYLKNTNTFRRQSVRRSDETPSLLLHRFSLSCSDRYLTLKPISPILIRCFSFSAESLPTIGCMSKPPPWLLPLRSPTPAAGIGLLHHAGREHRFYAAGRRSTPRAWGMRLASPSLHL
jgi:hypothetical protein